MAARPAQPEGDEKEPERTVVHDPCEWLALDAPAPLFATRLQRRNEENQDQQRLSHTVPVARLSLRITFHEGVSQADVQNFLYLLTDGPRGFLSAQSSAIQALRAFVDSGTWAGSADCSLTVYLSSRSFDLRDLEDIAPALKMATVVAPRRRL